MKKIKSSPAINGAGNRKNESWVESFISHTDNLESAPIFRRWAGISVVAAAMEMKTWITTSSPLYPNMYIYLTGEAGVGKTRAIMAAKGFIEELSEINLGATSMTWAALVDKLEDSKRTIVEMNKPALEFNSLYIVPPEFSSFMHKWETELVAGLTDIYDSHPYSQVRRTSSIDIYIKRPIINILTGATPSTLLNTTPETAWDGGYMSRTILIFSRDRPMIDIFSTPYKSKPPELIHDLKLIGALHGEFGYAKEFTEILHEWRLAGCPPQPDHPKLKGYVSRRTGHLLKLCMVSSADRGNNMLIEVLDFKRALEWMTEAEGYMPEIFRSGAPGLDSQAMDEILHFIRSEPSGVAEHKIMNFARLHVQHAYNMVQVLQIMERSGMIRVVSVEPKTGMRIFSVL